MEHSHVNVERTPSIGRWTAVTIGYFQPRPFDKRSPADLRWWLGVVVLTMICLLEGQISSVSAQTVEWREEVARQDGEKIVVAWRVELVPGEAFRSMVGATRFTFPHPKTSQPVVWENVGRIGSRFSPMLLDVDTDRIFLVMRAQAVADYSEMGCPTPPYFVFRYDSGAWVRIALAELPSRLWKANLLGYPGERVIRDSKGYITAAQVEAHFDVLRKRGDTEYFGRVDRRIRNPLTLGCNRDAVERIYGPEKYREWLRSGDWLDKTEEEALRMLRR